MKKFLGAFTFILTIISSKTIAIDEIAKTKYLYQLLTEDYGILDENDLGLYAWEFQTNKPFSEKITGRNYWQCFPTSDVSFDYSDGSYNDDVKAKTYSFVLTAKNEKGQLHEYMRKMPISKQDCQLVDCEWKKLMNDQRYVCLGGSFITHEKKITQGHKVQVYLWTFDKIKTKNGCDSYFAYHERSQCGLTYEEYKHRKGAKS